MNRASSSDIHVKLESIFRRDVIQAGGKEEECLGMNIMPDNQRKKFRWKFSQLRAGSNCCGGQGRGGKNKSDDVSHGCDGLGSAKNISPEASHGCVGQDGRLKTDHMKFAWLLLRRGAQKKKPDEVRMAVVDKRAEKQRIT